MKISEVPGTPHLAAFRQLAPVDQIRQLRGQTVERVFEVDRAAGIDTGKRTAWMSIASDHAYRRWFGDEILSMSAGSIVDDRLKRGLPLLVDHDSTDIVGKAEAFEITRDNKLRILARFGKSARAEEVWQDVLDGIRTDCSVGYVIHDLVLESEQDGINTYRVTSWEPLEGSLVSIPADYTVGVGRSHSTPNQFPISKGKKMQDNELQDESTQVLTRSQRRTAAKIESGGADSEAAGIIILGRMNQHYGGMELAARVIERGGTEDDFKREMFESMRGTSKTAAAAQEADLPPSYGSGARELLEMPKNFKGPRAQDNAYRSGQWLRAMYGKDEARRWCADHGVKFERDMTSAVNSLGGALVPNELSANIIDLVDSYGAFRRNADSYPMASDSLSVPRNTGDPTTAFVGEGSAIAEAAGTWDNVELNAKKIATIVRISTELMEDAVINVADRVSFQLARAFAKQEDLCGFTGDGTSTYGGMRGVFQILIDGGHTAGKVAAATNHDTFAEIDATDLANLIAAVPEYAVPGSKFYCSNLAWSLTFMRLMMANGGNTITNLTGEIPKSYAGFEVVLSPVLPASASTSYLNKVMIAFGNLRLASKFGARRDIRIKMLTERYADYDQVGIQASERFDIVCHDLGNTTTAGPMVGLIGG